jgi:hypothetical protein
MTVLRRGPACHTTQPKELSRLCVRKVYRRGMGQAEMGRVCASRYSAALPVQISSSLQDAFVRPAVTGKGRVVPTVQADVPSIVLCEAATAAKCVFCGQRELQSWVLLAGVRSRRQRSVSAAQTVCC